MKKNNKKHEKMSKKKRKRGLEGVPTRRLKKIDFSNVVRTREAIEAKKKRFSAPEKRKRKSKDMKVKSSSHGPLLTLPVHRGPKSNFQKKKFVLFTTGTSLRFFAGFGVCSDPWKKKKQKKKLEKNEKNRKRRKTNDAQHWASTWCGVWCVSCVPCISRLTSRIARDLCVLSVELMIKIRSSCQFAGSSVQPIPPDFGTGVCGKTPDKSYRVRAATPTVCLFNAPVASSWKLRNLELVGRITRRS